MKSVITLVTLLGITAGVMSCKKTINCETPVIKKVVFFSSLSSMKVPDTTAYLAKCRKGSNFGQVSEIFPKIYLMKADDYNKSMEFPMKGQETYDYDWEITLQPSNRRYRISAISHESATSKKHYCTNGTSYKLNDSLVTVPGNPYSTTPYYPADIQIEYW